MSRRRVFDIDFPQDAPETGAAAEGDAQHRRGPMATAIAETAEAATDREATAAAIREENDRLAHEFVRLKRAGRVTDLVALDRIDCRKLTRDRKPVADDDLADLKASILAIGLSNPIQVEPSGDRYELVQGFRRLTAYRQLAAETGEAQFAAIPATIVMSGAALDELYRRMVDENLVRRDISFAEMADLARAHAADPETTSEDVSSAIALLYASAGRQKRNYIGHFARLLGRIGDRLRFSEAMPRALGLDLERRLSKEPGLTAELLAFLESRPAETAEEEVEALRSFLTTARAPARQKGPAKAAAKTTIRYDSPGGMVRCLASDGRIELKAEQDFSRVDRERLEAALEAFFQALQAGEDLRGDGASR